MAKCVWDQTGEHFYETGDDHAVIYPYENGDYQNGEAWSGITGYTESPSGAEETALYADNIKYLSLRSAEEFGATVTAYTYPDTVALMNGEKTVVPGVKIYQQARPTFGLSIRTIIGNDTETNDHGYKLHLVYGLTMSPSEKGYSTVNDSPEAIEFSFELSSVPVSVKNNKSTSLITIDSTSADADKLKALEDILYGTDDTYTEFTGSDFDSDTTYYEKSGDTYTATTDTTPDTDKTYYTKTEGSDPRLPMPDEVIELMTVTTGG